MLPKPKRDSSDPVDEELESLQGETPRDSLKNFSTTIGIIFLSWSLHELIFEIENIPSQPKLLAWCSQGNNKISIVELETQQEFDEVKLNKAGGIFQPFISHSNSIAML